MNIIEPISNRRASRALSSDALSDDELNTIVGAGLLAPSCFNNQPWRIVIAAGGTLPALKESLSEGNAWAAAAPAILAIATRDCDDCRLDEGRDYAPFDAGLCVMNMLVQATAMDIIAHPIAGFNVKKARKALGIPVDYEIITLVILGKKGDGKNLTQAQQDGERAPRDRKPGATLAFRDRWPEQKA